MIEQAFGAGIGNDNARDILKERLYKHRKGKDSMLEPIKGLLRFYQPHPFAKAFGLKRHVRDGDFRTFMHERSLTCVV
ncbi:hypothetical protein A3SI_19096 [Nitritalea halalkaliphila LW7]|uniref:Uncharacterized protein n=1 Tax=Nitritalea halalkaliphila LW7 TaxID=1189621 RepID=I5BTG4_9BACT|nr:hypothetical protein [Nitritalea halalkaliphila]EIM72866.1 hypothetical protein A3SI_19096 [Nitritalea halalkaliphila LW7]